MRRRLCSSRESESGAHEPEDDVVVVCADSRLDFSRSDCPLTLPAFRQRVQT